MKLSQVVACACAGFGLAAAQKKVAPHVVPGIIIAAEYTKYDDVYVGIGPIREDDNALVSIVGTERAEYTVVTKEAGFYTIEYSVAGDPPDGKAKLFEIELVKGKSCTDPDTLQTNLYTRERFTTQSDTAQTPIEADGYISLPKGQSSISLCFRQVSDAVVFSITLVKTTPIPTPAPVMETPAPSLVVQDSYAVPGLIDAVGYYDYVDQFVGETGPRTGQGYLGAFGTAERALYKITSTATAEYQISMTVLAPTLPPAPVPVKFHFVLGKNACLWGENDSYYPTVEIPAYAGSKKPEVYTATNNRLRIPKGEHTLTMCVDYAGWLVMDTIELTVSDLGVLSVPTVNNATLFNSAYLTLIIIMGAGVTCGLACWGQHKVRSRYAAAAGKKAEPPVSPKLAATERDLEESNAESDAPSSGGAHPRTPHSVRH
jgi:hypothetical protein